jgi:hypothetical protein
VQRREIRVFCSRHRLVTRKSYRTSTNRSIRYIYSDVLRNRMLESMGLGPSDWWLPNDESCPPIIRSIKDFIKDRTQAPKDQVSDDLREMRGIFSSLTISDSPPSDNMTVTSADGLGSTYGSPDWQSSGYGSDRKSSSAEAYPLGSQQQYVVQ